MMAGQLSFEAPEGCVHHQNRQILPLLQLSERQVSESFSEIVSDEATGFSNTMQAPPAIEGHRQGTQVSNCLWVYREQLISLFWEQDLPLRKVQEIMKEQHGLSFRSVVTSLMSLFSPCWMLSLVHSTKVYKTQFRRWGIRKNLKGHEALNIAAGKGPKALFWPDNRVDEYAARIDRHVKKYRQNKALSRVHAGTVTTPSCRLRAPDALEKVEAASYYVTAYYNGCYDKFSTTWPGPFSREQEEFTTLFIRSLVRLSRNDQQNQAFKEINLAFELLKQLVSLDHPVVYLRLLASIAAFNQYPQSEICSAVCRMLSDYLKKLSWIVHGSNHPLNHVWGEGLFISAAEGPESFALGAVAKVLRQCLASEPFGMRPVDIEKCVSSDARGLDEASLRDRLVIAASRPDLLSQAQEIRLALCESLITQVRFPEALYFLAEAKAFQATDPIRSASKTLWLAELEWRSGNAHVSINTMKSALSFDEIALAGETNNGLTKTMTQEIKDILCNRQKMLGLVGTKHMEAHWSPPHKRKNGPNVQGPQLSEC